MHRLATTGKELKYILDERNIDINCITETKKKLKENHDLVSYTMMYIVVQDKMSMSKQE